MEERTLSIQRPFGGTLLLTILVFVILLAAGEGLARSRIFKAHFVAVSRGSPHFQFELQLGRLETVAAQQGSIDCIFLGNSMVWEGFEPLIFAQVYQEATGNQLRCYNFGVDGLPVAAAGALKQYLVKKYQPKLLIYGTDARDFAVPREDRDASVILDIPWMRYHMGHFSIQGWLHENLHLYRYMQTFGYLLRIEKQYLFIREPGRYTSEDLGYDGDPTISPFVGTSPALHLEMGSVRYYYKMLSNYQMLLENNTGFEEILQVDQDASAVLVVVMPVPNTYQDFFSNSPQGYQLFLDHIHVISEKYGSDVWSVPQGLIPQDGWADYTHLNTNGAAAFSAWLGRQLGEAVKAGSIFAQSR